LQAAASALSVEHRHEVEQSRQNSHRRHGEGSDTEVQSQDKRSDFLSAFKTIQDHFHPKQHQLSCSTMCKQIRQRLEVAK